jgi:hypothetical protein
VLRTRYGYGGPPAEGEWAGGCEIEPGAPDWRCARCSFEWAIEPDRAAAEETVAVDDGADAGSVERETEVRAPVIADAGRLEAEVK